MERTHHTRRKSTRHLFTPIILSWLSTVPAIAALDGPHNATSNIGCLSCHQMTSTYPKLLPPLQHTPTDIDDTLANNVCWSCHNDTNAPYAKTHSSLTTSNRLGNWTVECWVCHNEHRQEQNIYNGSTYGMYIRRSVNLANIKGDDGTTFVDKNGTTKSGIKPVVFTGPTGPNSFADGVDPLDGICEVCHTATRHFQNDGTASDQAHTNVGGAAGSNCMDCHSHENGFAHGGGAGTGCIDCHGHDAGSLFDPDMQAPFTAGAVASPGRGTVQSHSTHTETDSDDLKGPGLYCDSCHDIAKFPYFKSGTDANGDGRYDLAETDVCDACHSPSGTYDGLNDPVVGAKAIWRNGAYVSTADATLRADKEKWCATCHDEAPSVIGGVTAPNVIGDEDGSYTYGTGWGFYKTGHGLDSSQTYPASGGISLGGGKGCSDCHDYSNTHIDGKARSFDCGDGCDADEYRVDYRLKIVNGRNPMEIPLATNIAPNAQNYMLCFSSNGCHLPDKYLSKSTTLGTIFRDEDVAPADDLNPNAGWSEPLNAHEYHLNFKAGMGGRMVPDWRSTVTGTFSCTVCHNVHGSTQLAMIRDGKLVGREPGMKVLYTTVNDYKTSSLPTPANLTLDASTGTFWDATTSDNLCSDCHGNPGGSVGRIYRRTPPIAQQGPTLDWTGETGYAADGADPDIGEEGSVFEFRVKYSDANHDLPTVIQVWIDFDNDGYESNEKHDLWEADFDDHDTADGKIYRTAIEVNAGPDPHNYRFHARDRNADATGAPVTGGSITITAATNQSPVLFWTGEAGHESDGVDPNVALSDSLFTFRVKYQDTVNEAPTVQEVWIDLNDDGDFSDPNEKQSMALDGGDGDYTNGEIFTYNRNIPYPAGSLGGTLQYRFNFKDSDGADATGAPASALTFTVREAISSCNRTVCASSCTDTTIQAAVTNSSDGQTVCVHDGTWAPFAFNGKDITVRSMNGPAATIIDGGGSGTLVSFNTYSGTGSDATLKGFTLRDGNRGVDINNSMAKIADCIIEGNSAGGIHADNTAADPVVIDGAIIRNNTGPGIQNTNNTFTATVLDTVFSGNTAANGAGIYAQNGAGTYMIAGCEFSDNSATGNGGAADFGNRVTLDLTDSRIVSNSAGGDGGGIYSYGSPGLVNATVNRTVFAGNQAVNGAGVASGPGGGAFTFTNCLFSGNRASGNGGGMITSESISATNMFMNCTLAGNSAEIGGGISSKTAAVAALKVHNSIVWGNESRSSANDQIEGPIILDPGSTYHAEVKYSDIGLDQRYSVFSNQVGNMYIDPQFVHPLPASSAPTTDGDYHIMATSPVIDQALGASPPVDDLDGEARPNPASANIDMGADEYYPTVNLNETGAGTATAVAASETSISITMPYGKDFNGNNTYTVQYKLSSSGTWLDWGTNPKAHTASPYTDTITGLTPGMPYDVRMTYIDPDGVSGANPQTVAVVTQDYRTTAGVASAAMASVTSISISMPYTFDSNANNTYTLQYKLSSTGTWLAWGTNPKAHTASPYTDIITGLTAGETYDVRLTYNDADGVNGIATQIISGLLLSADATMAGTATATTAGDTSISIAMPYTFDNNASNTYTVQYKLSSSGTWLDWGANPKAHAASPYTDTITGLTPGATYDVQMTYNDANGVNGTNPQTVTTITLSHNSTTVGTATAAGLSDTSISLSMPYTGDNNASNTYTVQYKLSSSGTWLDWGANPKAHAASPYTDTITGLTPGATYDVQMTYNDANGVNGANLQTVTNITLTYNSTTVGAATAVKASGSSIAVSMPYTGDNNASNTYTVKYKLSSSGTWLDWGSNPKAHAASPYTDTITGLASGIYDVEMTYNDANGVNGTNPQTVTGIDLSSIACNIRVCTGETYTTIQAGINAAADGQTVCVCQGTYHENISFSAAKNIRVIAEGAVANSKIEGSGNTSVILFNNAAINSTTFLEGFTIANWYPDNATRGVVIQGGATPTIKNCIISNNTAYNNSGPGMHISGTGSGGTIVDSIIRNNTTGVNTGNGGGIYHSGTGALTISNSNIYANHAQGSGGGVYVSAGTASVSGTSIYSNTAGGDAAGGGIYVTGASLSLAKSFVLGNWTTSYGNGADGSGIRVDTGATATVVNSVIAGNTANAWQADGIGIYNAGTLNLYFSTIADNYANDTARAGGLQANGTETVQNSIIWGNRGLQYAGSIETLSLTETSTNPLFVAQSLPSGSGSPTTNGDYHLCKAAGDPDALCTGSSPCIDTADATNAPADDFEGDARPYNALFDKGADEYAP